MKKLILGLTIIANSAVAGISSKHLVEGIITKVEGDLITVVAHGKDIKVQKKAIPLSQRRPGEYVSIVTDVPSMKK
jgi:hypothetical protein